MNPLHVVPEVANFEIGEVIVGAKQVVIHAQTRLQEGCCPQCKRVSTHRHSHYVREVEDLPLGVRRVRLRLWMNRYRCYEPTCTQQTFREQHPGLVVKWGRNTHRHMEVQQQVGLALGGQAGVRLGSHLKLVGSRSTFLRRVRAIPPVPPTALTVVGVDDWALRKGKTYGTIVVDLIARHVVALLPDRTAETVATWLRAHPTIEIVTRDRASDYIKAIQTGAPQAQQVADRWHLLLNLRETVERALLQVYADTKAEIQYRPTATPLSVTARTEEARHHHQVLRQARFEAVHAAHAAGHAPTAIASACNLSRRTVDLWLKSPTLPPETRGRQTGSKVDAFGEYLHRRWQEGCHDQSKLWREIVAQGFDGTRSLVSRWLRARRVQPTTPPPPPLPPAKRAAWLLCRPPDTLDVQQTAFLARLRELPTVDLTYSLAQRFVRLMCDRQEADLALWLTDAFASTLPAWLSFATHLQRDWDAVSAACSLKWSNGPVEGHINRLKMLKRQMFGRAHLDLLQSRLCSFA